MVEHVSKRPFMVRYVNGMSSTLIYTVSVVKKGVL